MYIGRMKHLCVAFFLLPQVSVAQKVTRAVEPFSHVVYLATNEVTVKNFALAKSLAVSVNFRAIDQTPYVYLCANGDPIGPHDYAAFIDGKDTVAAYSTGAQAGLTAVVTSGVVPPHEYLLRKEDLQNLAQMHVTQIIISHYTGFQVVDIPEKSQGKVGAWAAALLNAMGH